MIFESEYDNKYWVSFRTQGDIQVYFYRIEIDTIFYFQTKTIFAAFKD